MKVILTKDVEKLGNATDVVEVADGYARNYLMPRSLASAATKSALANIENLKKQDERRQGKLRVAAQEKAAGLLGQTLLFEDANVGTGGRLYGSIGNNDIAAAILAQFGLEVDRHLVLLNEGIRAEGFYTVPVKLHRDVLVSLTVKVGNPPVDVATTEKVEAVEVEEVVVETA